MNPGSSWDSLYRSYLRDCFRWNVPAHRFEDFKAYWEMFARDGELQIPLKPAPRMMQRV